jgi:hypothetical protein
LTDSKKRCSRCGLSSLTPLIEFDEQGECNYCKYHQAITYRGEEEFLSELDFIKKRNDRKYDCIVALSGGRDSSFVLLKMAKDYKLKVLAVTYDNPYTHPVAKKNIENATSILNVDLVTIQPKKDIHRRTFRHNLKAWAKKPSPSVLPLICIACKLMWFDILRLAHKYKIPCIVTGENRFEDTSYVKALLDIPMKENWEKAFFKSIVGMAKGVIRNPRYLKPSFWPTYLKAYFFGDIYALGSRLFVRRMKLLNLFYYIGWREKEIISRIKSELNWESPSEVVSTWRFDCAVAALKDFIHFNIFGVMEKEDLFAKMVREGIITRDEALQRIELENQLQAEICRDLISESDLDFDEFSRMLERYSARFRLKQKNMKSLIQDR